MSPIANPAQSSRKTRPRDAGSVTYFLLGLAAGAVASWASRLPSGRPSKMPVGKVDARTESEDEPVPSTKRAPVTPSPGKVDNTSHWLHFWIGVILAVPVTVLALWLSEKYPAGPDNARLLVIYWAFMFVPGLSLIGLGVYMRRQRRRGLVMYALNRYDYLGMVLQFLPGTAIAILGNLLPPDGAKIADGQLSISWISIILGTAVSVMLVRKFDKPNP